MGGLDPATVAAARAAGIEDSALQEMGKLLAAKRLKKPEDAGEKPAPAGGAGLDEDDLAEDLEELNLDEPEQDGSRMEAAVLQLTKIVSTLAHPSRPSKPDLDSVLDAGVSSGSNEQQNLGQGRKSAAALRFLTKVYDENPKAIYEALERQMMLDFQVAPPKPGVPDYSGGNGTARGWLASKSRIRKLPQSHSVVVAGCRHMGRPCSEQHRPRAGTRGPSGGLRRPGLDRFRVLGDEHRGTARAASSFSRVCKAHRATASGVPDLRALRPPMGGGVSPGAEGPGVVQRGEAEARSRIQAGVARESPCERQGEPRGSERARAWSRTRTRPRRKWCPRGADQ